MKVTDLAGLVAALAGAVLAFPLAAQIENNTWRESVEPEGGVHVPAYGKSDVAIKDEAQLGRILSNIEQLNSLSGHTDDVGLFLLIEDPAPAANVKADKPPAK